MSFNSSVDRQVYVGRIWMFAGVLATLSLSAQVAPKQVDQKGSKHVFSHETDTDTLITWRHFPRWDGHALIGYLNDESDGPILVTFDKDGRRDETLFTMKDAARILIHDTAVSATGEIAVVGGALGGDRGATFLARIAPDRQSQIVTRVWPYVATAVTFASDGTIWTIGFLKDEENTRSLGYHLLRRFDPTGKMLTSQTVTNIGGMQTDDLAYLRASQDRVGWFTPYGHEYIEFSLDGAEIARYEGPDVEWDKINGVALSEDNEVVASISVKDQTQLVVLDRSTHTWVPASAPAEATAHVLGFDGTTLVVLKRNGVSRLSER